MKRIGSHLCSALISRGTALCVLPMLLFGLSLTDTGPVPDDTDDSPKYYRQGMAELEKGNYREAISIWEKAREEQSEPSFRIGQRAVSVAAKHDLEEKYRKASELYQWGLSDTSITEDREEVLKELEYMRPLLGLSSFSDYKDRVEEGDASVLKEIRSYWEKTDPTPLTDYNERLIEHWDRIAYSRENYAIKNGEELDDRADIYIRYGSPYYEKEGQLEYNSSIVNNLLTERFGSMSRRDNLSNREMVRMDQRFNLESYVRQMHRHSFYEVWIYENLTDDEESTIFLFGTSDGSTKYKKMKAIEDFIPNDAFRKYSPASSDSYNLQQAMSGNGSQGRNAQDGDARDISDYNQALSNRVQPQNITPALIFQIMYYQQFAALDRFFGEAFDRMQRRFNDNGLKISPSLARQFQHTHSGELIEIERRAPTEQSTYAFELPPMPMEVHSYRFIDENNEPYLKIFLESNPRDAGYYDQLTSDNRLNPAAWNNYLLAQGVVVLDEEGNEIEERRSNVSLSPDRITGITSVFDVKNTDSGSSLIAGSQLETKGGTADTSFHEASSFASGVKAVSREEVTPPESLTGDRLALSDILIGYESEGSEPRNDFVPFTVSHDRVIPEGENVSLYYELYNLERSADGISRFTFSYEITARRKGLAGIFGRKEEGVNITLNNESETSTHRQVLEIVTSSFKPGEYELSINIEDQLSGRTLSRDLELRIGEK